jgi:hypothetical protein
MRCKLLIFLSLLSARVVASTLYKGEGGQAQRLKLVLKGVGAPHMSPGMSPDISQMSDMSQESAASLASLRSARSAANVLTTSPA